MTATATDDVIIQSNELVWLVDCSKLRQRIFFYFHDEFKWHLPRNSCFNSVRIPSFLGYQKSNLNLSYDSFRTFIFIFQPEFIVLHRKEGDPFGLSHLSKVALRSEPILSLSKLYWVFLNSYSILRVNLEVIILKQQMYVHLLSLTHVLLCWFVG